MAEATTKASPRVERPLSPHLQVYSLTVSMLMSILHRITGAALYFGTLLLAAWLLAAASGRGVYTDFVGLLRNPVGLVVLVGYTWALVHHALGGIRHLLWDTGRGFELGTVNKLSWMTVTGSVLITAAIWAAVFKLRGGF